MTAVNGERIRYYRALITVPMDERCEAEDALACEGIEYVADVTPERNIRISVAGGTATYDRAIGALVRKGFRFGALRGE